MLDKLLYSYVADKAKEYSKELRADDPRFVGTVAVIMEDGSRFYWRNAFVHTIEEGWLCVFTEHYGDHVFDENDVVDWHVIRSGKI